MKLWGAVILMLALGACSTPYQSMGFMGGVAAQRIDETTVQISARGNAYTSPDMIQQYALRRAAEETVADGFDGFQILDSADRTKHLTLTTAGTYNSQTNLNAYGVGNSVYGQASTTGYYAPGQTYNYIKPGQALTIHMFKGSKPADAPFGTYDAHEILRYMTPPPKR